MSKKITLSELKVNHNGSWIADTIVDIRLTSNDDGSGIDFTP